MIRRVMRRRARSPIKPAATTARPASLESNGGLDAFTRPLSSPLVVFTQPSLMFFHLGFQFAERFLAARSHGRARAGGVQSSGGQRQIQRAGILVRTGSF